MLFLCFVLLIIFSILASTISYKLYHKIWNPIHLFLFTIILSLVFTIFTSERSIKETEMAVIWITIGVICFISSFIFCQENINKHTKTLRRYYIYNTKTLCKFVNLCLIITIIVTSLSLYNILQISNGFMNIFLNSTYVRNQYLHRTESTPIILLNIFLSLNFRVLFCLLPIALYEKCKGSRWKVVFILLLRLFSSIITMSKQAFLIDCIIFLTAYVNILKREKEEIIFFRKYLKWFVSLIVVLLVVISFQRNYVGTRYENYLESVIGTIQSYIAIPTISFGALISQPKHIFQYGRMCFRPVISLLSYLGIGTKSSVIQEAVIEGIGNVYTIFGNMFRDFGFPGIIFLSIFFGCFLGFCYRLKVRNKLSIIIINSIVVMIMFFGYFDLILMQTVYLFSMIYAVVFERVIRKKLYLGIEEL